MWKYTECCDNLHNIANVKKKFIACRSKFLVEWMFLNCPGGMQGVSFHFCWDFILGLLQIVAGCSKPFYTSSILQRRWFFSLSRLEYAISPTFSLFLPSELRKRFIEIGEFCNDKFVNSLSAQKTHFCKGRYTKQPETLYLNYVSPPKQKSTRQWLLQNFLQSVLGFRKLIAKTLA